MALHLGILAAGKRSANATVPAVHTLVDLARFAADVRGRRFELISSLAHVAAGDMQSGPGAYTGPGGEKKLSN